MPKYRKLNRNTRHALHSSLNFVSGDHPPIDDILCHCEEGLPIPQAESARAFLEFLSDSSERHRPLLGGEPVEWPTVRRRVIGLITYHEWLFAIAWRDFTTTRTQQDYEALFDAAQTAGVV